MVQSNTVSIFVTSQVPDFYNRDAPELMEFIRFYYEWLEQYENPVSVARKLEQYKDVDLIPEKFFSFMRLEFMKSVPVTIADERLLMKNIVDFYKSRGTEKSYRMLFRILYGDHSITFYYPGQDILRASDGKWVVERSLKINVNKNADIENVVSIRGNSSGASARKDKFLSYVVNEVKVNEFYITHVFGNFTAGEMIYDDIRGHEIGYIQEVVTYPGGWVGTDGFLSSNKYLPDNNFYQEYSYQIKSTRSLSDYSEIAHNLVHPSGTKMFGAVDLVANLDYSDIINLTVISSLAGEESSRISINYQVVIGPTSFDMDSDIVGDIDSQGIGILSVSNASELAEWLDFQPFSGNLGDVTMNDMDKYIWLRADVNSFTFPNYTPLELTDTVNDAISFTYAKNVINPKLLLTTTEYAFGSTTGITYKYFTIA